MSNIGRKDSNTKYKEVLGDHLLEERTKKTHTQVLNDIYGFSQKCIHLENLFAVVYHPSFTVRLEAKFRRAEKRTTTKRF